MTATDKWNSAVFDKGLTVLVTGSRDWENEGAIREWLDIIDRENRIDLLIHGDCPRGADHMADRWARLSGVEVDRHPANWKEHGRPAGFIRNAEMVSLNPDVVLAFQRDESKGTQHTIDLARKRGIEVILEIE